MTVQINDGENVSSIRTDYVLHISTQDNLSNCSSVALFFPIMMRKPGCTIPKTTTGICHNKLVRCQEVPGFKSTVGGRRPPDSSVLICLSLSVHQNNLPYQTPAQMIDGYVENRKPLFTVTKSAIINNIDKLIYLSLRLDSHSARDVSCHC